MKVKILTIALAILAGTFASCSKQDDDINNISEPGVVSERMADYRIGGIYTVDRFMVNDHNQAANFRNVRLLFAENNVLYVMQDGATRYKGAWGADYVNKQMKIGIENGDDRINQLNGGYRILSMDRQYVKLQSVNDPTKVLALKKAILRPRVMPVSSR